MDEGIFDESMAICEELLEQDNDSAQLHYLLGRTMDATGNIYMAEEHLRKAIYLDPDFLEALVYLAVLCERMGDFNKAVGFRNRAERVRQRMAEDI